MSLTGLPSFTGTAPEDMLLEEEEGEEEEDQEAEKEKLEEPGADASLVERPTELSYLDDHVARAQQGQTALGSEREVRDAAATTSEAAYFDNDENSSSDEESGGERGGRIRNYSEPNYPMWMIGVSFDTLQSKGFPGNDGSSFGLRSDGTLFHNGEVFSYCGDLRDEVVVGMLLDLNVGTITAYAGGACLGAAFGVDAVSFPPNEQARQGQLIRNKHLIPSFAIRAARSERDEVASIGLTETLSEDMQPSALSSEPGESMTDDDGVKGANQDASFAQPNGSDVPPEPWGDEVDVEPTTIVPALTINFGGYQFARLPPQSLSCDSYLSFAHEAKQGADKARFAEELRRQMKSVVDKSGHGRHEDEAMGAALATRDEDRIIREYQDRVAFFNQMHYTQPQSWSDFPPQAHRLSSSANMLQRAIRRFLGRKWRRRELLAQAMAISVLQRRIKSLLPRWRRQKHVAAVNVQKMWRAAHTRREQHFALEFSRPIEEVRTATVRVQALFRRGLAERRARHTMEEVESKIEGLKVATEVVQRNWRKFQGRKRFRRRSLEYHSAASIQRVWRSAAVRRTLVSTDSEATQRRLWELGHSIVRSAAAQRAAVKLQRVWRGAADRDYARMRRAAFDKSARIVQFCWRSYLFKRQINALYDSGPADAVKQFLKCLKIIV